MMSLLVLIIFFVLVMYIIWQRWQIKWLRYASGFLSHHNKFLNYYVKFNEKAWKHADYRADLAEGIIKILGYDIDNLSGGHFLSPEDQNKLLAKLDKQKSELDESEELFEIEEAKYKKYASDWS